MPLSIVRATPTDTIPWPLLLNADASRGEVQKYLKRGELWLAKNGSKVDGAMILMETLVGTVEIMNIAVNPKLQSRGIGTSLLRAAKRRAKQLGASTLHVGTGNNSFGQLIFYQRFGFRIVGVSRNFFVGRYSKTYVQKGVKLLDSIRMEMPV